MGAKTFHTIYDFARHGMNIHLACLNCPHTGVVEAYPCSTWFRVHRWPIALEAEAWRRFRCTRCGHKGANLKPTDMEPTVTTFFPANERGWKELMRRLRY